MKLFMYSNPLTAIFYTQFVLFSMVPLRWNPPSFHRGRIVALDTLSPDLYNIHL